MASSAHKQQQQLPNMYGTTAAPPPTPSALSTNSQSMTAATADALSRLLHHLPPTLSLPTRRSPASSATTSPPPPLISLSDPNLNDRLLSSASQLGFFQLTDHDISSQLAQSAELESLSLFALEKDKKESYFPKNWPLGHEADEEDGDRDRDRDVNGESFCLDSSCSTESTELNLNSLREFTRAMEKVGMKMVEMLASAVGFENPIGEDPTRICSLMWVSEGLHDMDGDKPVLSGGFYPYVVALQYQIRQQKYSLSTNSCWVTVSPQVDSILVTLGDVAQVWSNGKLKKVRGRPCLVPGNAKNNNSQSISMSLLVTLPIESRVSPLIIIREVDNNGREENDEVEEDDQIHGSSASSVKKKKEEENKLMFESFCFEDYAWRLYRERLLLKDPLDRYRI
ncbi:hypothetical protein EZV62_025979 [Acer yangbiense]|uniref:Non-haem dioxygenase N-terminal domain-containing protein n=1 Tax=Acer yangbiense TaxID=1000413 RepID=A0A5C7GZB0_9ROSI|nr:hypothetical protein EZV62_025979 [Acer yangbiense]